MQPALPPPDDEWRAGDGADTWFAADDVGEFRQGSPFSRWALARYLVGRALLASVSTSLLLIFFVLLAGGVLLEWEAHLTFLAVLVFVVAAAVLLLLLLLRAVLHRLMAAERIGPLENRLTELVASTRRDVRRELGRVGLPHHIVTLPLLAVRLVGRRRRTDTVARIRRFEVERAVPKARLDEVHMLLRDVSGRPGQDGAA